jgi:hypothetical protein
METWVTILTFVILVLSFGVMYLSIKYKSKKYNFLILLSMLITASPLAYALYDDYKNEYIGANIGLGLAFLLTWGITGIILLVAIIKLIRVRRS